MHEIAGAWLDRLRRAVHAGLAELAALARQYPSALHTIPLDVGSIESTRAAAQTAGEQSDHLDLLINNAGVLSPTMYRSIREPQDYAEMHRLYDVNALGPLRVVEAFLPLMDRGAMKRLCFVSSEAGSIARCSRTSWYSYCMSKTALNMAVRILFNHLRPEGYTFRLYHPGWMRTYMSGQKNAEADLEPEEAAARAIPFFVEIVRMRTALSWSTTWGKSGRGSLTWRNDMNLTSRDRDVLRRLAEQQAEIAALPVHKEKAELWRRLNDLQPARPMVWINEIPWNEMNVDDELTLQCADPWAREVEGGLRRLLYQWRHLPADMVVDEYIPCPLVVRSTGFGLARMWTSSRPTRRATSSRAISTPIS